MKKLKVLTPAITLGVLTLSILAANAQSPYLVTYYNFKGYTTSSNPVTFNAVKGDGTTLGNGTLTTPDLLTSYSATGAVGASDSNKETTDSQPPSAIGSTNATGKSFTLNFDKTGYGDLIFSFAEQGSNTGPTNGTLSVGTSATNFLSTQTVTLSHDGSFHTYSVYIPASQTASSNTTFLKFTLNDGASTGTTRFTYVKVTAPAPSSLLVALAGIPGIGLMIRRRKAAK